MARRYKYTRKELITAIECDLAMQAHFAKVDEYYLGTSCALKRILDNLKEELK